jgi:hypothetical protein
MHVSNMQINKIRERVKALNTPSDEHAPQIDRAFGFNDPSVGKSFQPEGFRGVFPIAPDLSPPVSLASFEDSAHEICAPLDSCKFRAARDQTGYKRVQFHPIWSNYVRHLGH